MVVPPKIDNSLYPGVPNLEICFRSFPAGNPAMMRRLIGKNSGSYGVVVKVSSIGGGGTAAYIDGIVGRLDHLLSLGVVEGKFIEAKGKMNRLGLRLGRE